jgi:hypothetical protein
METEIEGLGKMRNRFVAEAEIVCLAGSEIAER